MSVTMYIHTVTLHYINCLHVCGLYTQGGLSALMMCCENGNSEMAKFLLGSAANPDLQQSVEYHKHSLYVIGNFPKTMESRLFLALGMQMHANVLNHYILRLYPLFFCL